MPAIRVLLVEDSLTVRKQLCAIVESDPELELVGEAEDGKQAIELCQSLRPDVISMDMMLPLLSGLAATEYIMAHRPTPILVVSASVNRGELFKTYEALAAGAVDVMEKPRGDEPTGVWERGFLGTLKLASRIRVITHPRARLRGMLQPAVRPPLPANQACQVVAIGASTGGPSAILEILRTLPAGFSLPILLVLHINAPFGAAFAEWLDGQTQFRVTTARTGQSVAAAKGGVIMAPPDMHLTVRAGRVELTNEPERHSCRPSVDVLFESIAREYAAGAAACLLTGMGRDGAAGLLRIRVAGGVTVAQDEASCVVYGMPREAVMLGAATHVLPLQEIGSMLATLPGSRAEVPP